MGLISRVIEEIGSNDVLLRLNGIHILSELALSEHGYAFLDQQGTFDRIFGLINEDELTTQLCQPGKRPLAKQILVDHLLRNPEVLRPNRT